MKCRREGEEEEEGKGLRSARGCIERPSHIHLSPPTLVPPAPSLSGASSAPLAVLARAFLFFLPLFPSGVSYLALLSFCPLPPTSVAVLCHPLWSFASAASSGTPSFTSALPSFAATAAAHLPPPFSPPRPHSLGRYPRLRSPSSHLILPRAIATFLSIFLSFAASRLACSSRLRTPIRYFQEFGLRIVASRRQTANT